MAMILALIGCQRPEMWAAQAVCDKGPDSDFAAGYRAGPWYPQYAETCERPTCVAEQVGDQVPEWTPSRCQSAGYCRAEYDQRQLAGCLLSTGRERRRIVERLWRYDIDVDPYDTGWQAP